MLATDTEIYLRLFSEGWDLNYVSAHKTQISFLFKLTQSEKKKSQWPMSHHPNPDHCLFLFNLHGKTGFLCFLIIERQKIQGVIFYNNVKITKNWNVIVPN